MSQNENLTQVQLLTKKLETIWESLAECNPYQNSSEMERVNERIGIGHVPYQITQKTKWEDKIQLYEVVLLEFNQLKKQFTEAVTKLLQVDNKVHSREQ